MSGDKEGGLASWAEIALGFDLMCRCGHEEGYHGWHERGSTACDVIECGCEVFTPVEPPCLPT